MSRRGATNDTSFLRSGRAQAARPSSSASGSGSLFTGARNFAISDGQFNNVQGNLVINLNQNSLPQSSIRNRITVNNPSISSHRNTRTNTIRGGPRASQSSTSGQIPVQQGNIIYQRHLQVKGRGFPLWIPSANQNLPIQYRRTSVRIGDVGIITHDGGFSFLFNICLPHDDPVNPTELPEHFSPIFPPIQPTHVDKFLVFRHGSHLASASVEKTQSDSQFPGFQFESSASEGAILTMPFGATSESLGNVARFRQYISSNIVHWYKFVNGVLGREVKNGDIRLVIGCDKTIAWGIATFANNESRQNSCRLNFGPLEESSSNSISSDSYRYAWGYSGIADVRAGPSPGENDELRQSDDPGDIVYENQCLFLRTLNTTLCNTIWSEINSDLGFVDLQSQSGFPPTEDPASKPSSTSRTSATRNKSSSLSSHRLGNRRSLGPHSEFQNIDNKPVLDSSSPSALIGHPSSALNDILMAKVPAAHMVITQDEDWSCIASKYNTFPDPHELVEQILVSHCICEENGIIFLDQRSSIQTTSSSPELVVTSTDEILNNPAPGADGSFILAKRLGTSEETPIILEAGAAQGITVGSRMAVHASNLRQTASTSNPCRGYLTVTSVGPFTSVLEVPSDTELRAFQPPECSFQVYCLLECRALQNIALYCEDRFWLETVFPLEQQNQLGITIVDDVQSCDLELTVIDRNVYFDRHRDVLVTPHIGSRISHTIDIGDVSAIREVVKDSSHLYHHPSYPIPQVQHALSEENPLPSIVVKTPRDAIPSQGPPPSIAVETPRDEIPSHVSNQQTPPSNQHKAMSRADPPRWSLQNHSGSHLPHIITGLEHEQARSHTPLAQSKLRWLDRFKGFLSTSKRQPQRRTIPQRGTPPHVQHSFSEGTSINQRLPSIAVNASRDEIPSYPIPQVRHAFSEATPLPSVVVKTSRDEIPSYPITQVQHTLPEMAALPSIVVKTSRDEIPSQGPPPSIAVEPPRAEIPSHVSNQQAPSSDQRKAMSRADPPQWSLQNHSESHLPHIITGIEHKQTRSHALMAQSKLRWLDRFKGFISTSKRQPQRHNIPLERTIPQRGMPPHVQHSFSEGTTINQRLPFIAANDSRDETPSYPIPQVQDAFSEGTPSPSVAVKTSRDEIPSYPVPQVHTLSEETPLPSIIVETSRNQIPSYPIQVSEGTSSISVVPVRPRSKAPARARLWGASRAWGARASQIFKSDHKPSRLQAMA